ncbi:MAG: sigma-70 family RNA polymerase sigma factor [Gemmataceae bacterium]
MSPGELARLIETQAPALTLYARQWCEGPEDIVQQAFLALVTQRCPPRDPVGWLYRAVRNGALDALKKRRRRLRREAEAARAARWFVEPEVDGLDAEAAVGALRALPMEQREPIVAHLWGGLSFEQIGEVAGCSASTAFRRYSAGLVVLRKKLGVPCSTQ